MIHSERTIKFNRTALAQASVALIILLALLSSGQLLVREIVPYVQALSGPVDAPSALDAVSRHEKRFEELRDALSTHGVVGYVTDQQDGTGFTSQRGFDEYVITQYILAPVIVINSREPQFVVGNFSETFSGEPRPALQGFRLVRDFGDGVVLYARE